MPNWPLTHDASDHTGSHHGIAHNVRFEDDPAAPGGRAAVFDGISSRIEIPAHEALAFGTAPFTISLHVKVDPKLTTAYGDILSKFDTDRRRGLTLNIGSSSSGYCSLSDQRQVFFGMDNAVDSPWLDHGKPWPSNQLVSTLTVFDGHLYTGIGDADQPDDSPAIFRFEGGQKWEFCGKLDVEPAVRSVQSMIVHDGHLYAGTGTWDWARVKTQGGPTRVFRYEGGTKWVSCGQFGTGRRVSTMASFDGHLYAGDDAGHAWRYEGGQQWTCCGQVGDNNRCNAMMVYRGHLYASPHGSVWRYEGGTEWKFLGGKRAGNFYGEGQNHCLHVYESRLWAGLWPRGKALQYAPEHGEHFWADRGTLGCDPAHRINEINDLTAYNGKLYAGLLPKAQVFRLWQDDQWTMLKQLVDNEAYDPSDSRDSLTWNRAPGMAVFAGRLFVGTSNCHGSFDSCPHEQSGRVFSYEAGRNVSYDRDLGGGWHHLQLVRDDGELRLFVDGKLVSRSATFDGAKFDLTNTIPLQIGVGPQNHFRGSISDVRLYDRVIEP